MVTKSLDNLYFLDVAESSVIFPQLGKIVLCACTSKHIWAMHKVLMLVRTGATTKHRVAGGAVFQPQQRAKLRQVHVGCKTGCSGGQYAQYPPGAGASRLSSLFSMLCFWSGTSVTDCLCWQGSG